LNGTLFETSSGVRPSAPFRFLKGRWENFLTLKQSLFYRKLRFYRIVSRYKKILGTIIFSFCPLIEHRIAACLVGYRLLRILTFAKNNIPFYQNCLSSVNFEGLTSKDDIRLCLAKLPILTKDIVRSQFPDKILRPRNSYYSHLLAKTSGTTSQSIQHIRPENADTRTLINSVISYEKGFLTRPVFVLSTPHCSGLNCSLTGLDKLVIPYSTRSFFLRHLADLVPLPTDKNILEQDPEVFHQILRILTSYQPSILVGDPVYLAAFSWFLIENKLIVPKVNFILTSYELLTPTQKTLLKSVFRCPVHSQYGGSEVLGVARTCSHGFFHESEFHVLVEVEKNGLPSQPGEIGEVLLTDLSNFNMPFIRYKIGDAVERLSGKCPCGALQRRLGLIHGRYSDLFLSSHQTPIEITPLMVDNIFEGITGVKFYRVTKKGPFRYEIAFIPSFYFRETDIDLIELRAKVWLGAQAELTFKKKEFFRPEASMKFRFSFEEIQA